MPYYASKEFRMNCYDKSKKQRIAFVSDDVVITNENITTAGNVHFHLSSMTGDKILFGETPENTVTLPIFNEDGQYSREDLLNRDFKCNIGVEVSGRADDIFRYSHSVVEIYNDYTDARHKNVEWFTLNPYGSPAVAIRSNCEILNTSFMWAIDIEKLVYVYGYLYGVGDGVGEEPTQPRYIKLKRIAPFKYEYLGSARGEANEIISEREIRWLERFRLSDIDGMSLSDRYMIEWKLETTSPETPFIKWSNLSSQTWGSLSSHNWSEYYRYSQYTYTSYESVPMGVWEFEPPRRVRESILTLNGRDRMHKFDVDSMSYATNVGLTNISVRDQAITMSNYTGVPCDIPTMRLNTLANNTMCNPSNYYSSKTIKDLLSYCFEVGANNAIIDRYGKLTGMNPSTTYPIYETEPTVVGVTHFYALDQAEAIVTKINKVLTLKQGDTVMLETVANDGETYDWNDNPFFNGNIAGSSWFSNGMTDKLSGYNPIIFSTDADYTLWADDVCPVLLDGVWVALPIFSMDIDWCGTGIVTYEVGGEEHREIANYSNRIESVASTNDTNMQGLNKAQYANKLYFDENGLTVESQGLVIKNANGETVFSADDDGNLTLTGTINADAGHIGNWDIVNDNLECRGSDDPEEFAFLGKIIGLPYMRMKGSVGFISSDKLYQQMTIDYKQIKFADAYGDTVESIAEITGRLASGNRDIWIRAYGNNSPELGPVSVTIESPFMINLISPLILLDNSIHIQSVPTTSATANTALVSDSNGYEIRRVTSLRKNKDNIKTIANAWETVDNVRGVQFTSKCEGDNPKTVHLGFIADEVEKVEPRLVTYNEKGELESVQYDRFAALLIEDNKECHRRIRELEERLKKVEDKLNGI